MRGIWPLFLLAAAAAVPVEQTATTVVEGNFLWQYQFCYCWPFSSCDVTCFQYCNPCLTNNIKARVMLDTGNLLTFFPALSFPEQNGRLLGLQRFALDFPNEVNPIPQRMYCGQCYDGKACSYWCPACPRCSATRLCARTRQDMLFIKSENVQNISIVNLTASELLQYCDRNAPSSAFLLSSRFQVVALLFAAIFAM